MLSLSDARIVTTLHKEIEEKLGKVGILSRVYSRAKTKDSLRKKIEREPNRYAENGRKIQDVFGIRVVVYFTDDSVIAQQIVKEIFQFDSSSIDVPSEEIFSAIRCNLIFKLPPESLAESDILKKNKLLDDTFEVQFRTTLSEGWHEVEHDLRYKCQEDWKGQDDLSRSLNGIYASLETSDWGMLKVFEELAYRHYKSHKFEEMIRTKFRLRFITSELSDEIREVLKASPDIFKRLFRVNRKNFILKLVQEGIHLPLTLDNIVFLANHYFIRSDSLTAITPLPILDELI